jgi:hypothetical protein
MESIELGGRTLTTPATQPRRMSILLWGASKCGKTTLASTAPKEILWINYDPDGLASLGDMEGVHIFDLSSDPVNSVMKFRAENPLNLDAFLEEHPEIETVVFDSLTTFGDKALVHGVTVAKSTKKGRDSTLEEPGYSGYGNKNTWTRICVKHLLAITGKHNRHMIFIAHEDSPTRDDQGHLMFITLMLGSSLVQQVPIDLSEVWHLDDTGKERRIAVRACRMRKPMGSRMFLSASEPEFIWDYNSESGSGQGIGDWYDTWVKNKGRKIPLP